MRSVVPVLLTAALVGQPAAAGKRIRAKSFLDRKAPALVVQKWLTPAPATKGKLVLIDFWATWCGPCRRAIPELNEISRAFGDRLVVIGLSDETEAKVRAMKEPRIDYAVAIDPRGRLSRAVGVTGIRHVLLIDPQGYVRWEGYPLLEGYELTPAVVKAVIDQYSP